MNKGKELNCYVELRDGHWDIRYHLFPSEDEPCKWCGFILPEAVKKVMGFQVEEKHEWNQQGKIFRKKYFICNRCGQKKI